MEICLIIEQDTNLWQSVLICLHMRGFKWYRTGMPLNNFHHLKDIAKYNGKGLGINFKDKTVAWTTITQIYDYCIEVKK